MPSLFRQLVDCATQIGADVLGEEFVYTPVATGVAQATPVRATPHVTNLQLFQELEMREGDVLLSIPRSYIQTPQVGDILVSSDSGFEYEIDGLEQYESESRTIVLCRSTKEWLR